MCEREEYSNKVKGGSTDRGTRGSIEGRIYREWIEGEEHNMVNGVVNRGHKEESSGLQTLGQQINIFLPRKGCEFWAVRSWASAL